MPDKTPVQQAYDRVVGNIRDTLREHGFKGSAPSFHLREDQGTFVVGFLKDKYSDRHQLSFTVNLGYGVRALYDRYEWPKARKTPSIAQCHFIRRLGWYNYHRAPDSIAKKVFAGGKRIRVYDVWWMVRGPKADEYVLPELRPLLLDIALPEMLKWRDMDTFIADVETDGGFHETYRAWLVQALRTDGYVEPPNHRPAG